MASSVPVTALNLQGDTHTRPSDIRTPRTIWPGKVVFKEVFLTCPAALFRFRRMPAKENLH